jgi:ketosteroid isomerase-like protein
MGEWSAATAVAAVEAYALAATESRYDDVADLFAEDAELRDPYDGPIIRGREAIREFFRGGVDMIDCLGVAGPVRVTADARIAAAPMKAEVTIEGASLEMDTIDVFFFDESGRFSAMHAFYGPTNVRPR